MNHTNHDLDPLLGPEMHLRHLRISGEELVYLRALLEAYDGLAFVYGRGDGVVRVVTTADQRPELDSLLTELQTSLAFVALD